MKPKNGADLMLRFAQGDESAFESLVARYEQEILNFFYRLTMERHTAEDMAQDLFLRVYQAKKTYQAQTRFRYFLYRIARNLWIDLYRKKKSAPSLIALGRPDTPQGNSDAPGEFTDRDSQTSPPEQAILHENKRRLAYYLTRLPEKQREVIALSMEGGMRYAEISEILAIPVGTIKSRMHAAVTMLKKWMKGEGEA
ncbi:MAG: RNA polymerase sigma factor [Planctomycetes bacterium]|nr:RNA polymerase sigma factor [Planctomycetota bacterium]